MLNEADVWIREAVVNTDTEPIMLCCAGALYLLS